MTNYGGGYNGIGGSGTGGILIILLIVLLVMGRLRRFSDRPGTLAKAERGVPARC